MSDSLQAPNNSSDPKPAPRRSAKRILGIVVFTFVVALLALVFALSHPQHDFIEYWTASHLLLSRGNPYSLMEAEKVQKALGWNEFSPLMFVSPPWSLPLLVPLGLTSSYLEAWLLWMAALVAALALSSLLLMNIYFGDLRIPEVTDTVFCRCLFAFTFIPILLCLKFAQTAPFLLLGLAGFLYFIRSNRPVLAGAFLSLTSIKPQLLLLVWLAVLLESARLKRWSILFTASSMICLFTIVALVLDPRAFQQYRELVSTPYLSYNPSGIAAMIRRMLVPRNTYWMQFVPPFFGTLWLAWYWRRHRTSWNWIEEMPVLVIVSVLTSAYGWVFDQTVLAVAVIAIAGKYARPEGRIPFNMIIWYTALNCVLMLLIAIPPLTYLPAPIALAFAMWRNARSSVKPASSLERSVAH